ncbi:hypothetical protein GCM10022222_70250 [Amycolatopsis ultiminotia]|uniref:Uncharacterized protein n=1 Tax=Amycolatopsis ultiminotia TaxID=543629 RepID=A0ABP6Y105_9PSEU
MGVGGVDMWAAVVGRVRGISAAVEVRGMLAAAAVEVRGVLAAVEVCGRW